MIKLWSKQSQETQQSILRQLYKMLGIIIIPMLILVLVLLYMLFSFNHSYANVLQNANTAAEFNSDFRREMTRKMWYSAISTRGEAAHKHLPDDDIEHATEVLLRLKETTTQPDNQFRINSMLNLTQKLEENMIDIDETPSYDERMTKLDGNFATIAALIETYMNEYISTEIRYMKDLQAEVASQVKIAIALSLVTTLALTLFLLFYTVRFAKRIVDPISQLAGKVQRLGEGDFSVTPVATSSTEIATLDAGFDEMAGRIDALMAKEIEDQKALHRTELELMQSQINPHFLYNTLDSLVWLAETGRNQEVVQMVTSLSVFFRKSLSKGKDIITVGEEYDQVRSYLEIQIIRYSDILTYEINLPENIWPYQIPKLTLQPLVENAIYHGIKNKRGGGKIIIAGEEKQDCLVLTVSDNGGGMAEEQLDELRRGIYRDDHGGLGLINVHKRLLNYFGQASGLHFDSEVGEGTVVTIIIPKNI